MTDVPVARGVTASAACITAHCFQTGGSEQDFQNIVGERFSELLVANPNQVLSSRLGSGEGLQWDVAKINSRNDVHRLLVKPKLGDPLIDRPASFVLCTQASKGKLVSRIELAARADWILLLVSPYDTDGDQLLLNIWYPLAAAMAKNTIVAFDPSKSPNVITVYNKTCGKMLSGRKHILVPVQLDGAPQPNESPTAEICRVLALEALVALLLNLPPQSVFAQEGISTDDGSIDVVPQSPVPLPSATPQQDAQLWRDHLRNRFSSLSRAEYVALARAEYVARCALPLRLIQVCTFGTIRVTQFLVAEGVLRIGDRLVSASDPAATAVEGNGVFSMRLFPENVPITVAYPGQYIGIQTALHAKATSPFDVLHTVVGRLRASAVPTHPRAPAIIAGFTSTVLRGDISANGIGGAAPLQIVACEKQESSPNGGMFFVAIARSSSSVTYCDDFNMCHVIQCAMGKKYILIHRAVDGPLSATNGFVPVAIDEASVYHKLDIHYAAAAILRRQLADKQSSECATTSAGNADVEEAKLDRFVEGQFLSPSSFGSGSNGDDSAARHAAFCKKHASAFERVVRLELLSILTPAQHQLGLEPEADRKCGRFTLLFMFARFSNPKLFTASLTKIVAATGKGELPMASLPHHWIPTTLYDSTKAEPNAVISQLIAACCTSKRKVRDVSSILTSGSGGSNLEAMMLNSFIATGVLMPVYDLLRGRSAVAMSDGDLVNYLKSPSLPSFILLQLAIRGAFGSRTIDYMLVNASPHVRKHALRWLAAGAGCVEGQTLSSKIFAAIGATRTVEDLVRLYLFHSSFSAKRMLVYGGNSLQWVIPVRAIQLIAQFI